MKRFLKIWAVCLLLICTVSPAITPSKLSSQQDSLIMDVYADELSQQGQEGLAVLIAMLVANGLRFTAQTAEGIKDGVSALWDKAVNAGKVTMSLAQVAASTFWQGRNMRMNAEGMTAINAFQQWLQNEYNLSLGESQVFSYETTGTVTYENLNGNLWSSAYEITTTRLNTNYIYTYVNTPARLVAFYSEDGNNYLVQYGVISEVGSTANRTITTISSSSTIPAIPSGTFGYQLEKLTVNNITYFVRNTGTRVTVADFANKERYVHINKTSSVTNKEIYDYAYGDLALDDRVVLEGQTNQLVDGYTPNADQVVSTDTDGLADYVGVGAITNTADLEAAINAAIAKGIAAGLEGAIPWDLLQQELDQKVEGEDTVPITPTEASAYKVLGLQNVFPFSIPFTMAQVFTLLEAEPVTPHFPVVFKIPGIVDYYEDVELKDWDGVAEVVRNVYILPLILGLILITRNIIKG